VSVEDGSLLVACGLAGYVVVLASSPKGDAGVRATLDKPVSADRPPLISPHFLRARDEFCE
jgi:hypothetical protein